MNVLVTGATGFVGGHLVDALLARGDTITALVRDPGKAKELIRRGVGLVVGDLDDVPALERAARDQEVIYHLAGLIAARDEAEFLRVNRDGTERLVTAAERVGASRLVLISSLAAGGPSEPDRPLVGVERPQPVTRYGRSKLAGEEVVRAARLSWTIIRPPVVYGPGDREMLRVFRAASLGIAPVFGDGSQRLSLVFGPDLAGAIVAAGTAAHTAGAVYYPCHPETITSRELVTIVGRAVGKRVLRIGIPGPVGRALLWTTDTAARLTGRATLLSLDKAAEFLAPAWTADPGPLTQATSWSATHDFETGARRTVEWYRARGWL